MEDAFVHSAARQALPRAFEFLRAISGLVAIAALLVVVAKAPTAVDPAQRFVVREAPPSAGIEVTAPDRVAPALRPSFDGRRDERPTMVYYLVANGDQEYLADTGEQSGAMEAFASGLPVPNRDYEILYARDESEEQLAGAAILHGMLMLADDTIVQVIDLRDVCVEPC